MRRGLKGLLSVCLIISMFIALQASAFAEDVMYAGDLEGDTTWWRHWTNDAANCSGMVVNTESHGGEHSMWLENNAAMFGTMYVTLVDTNGQVLPGEEMKIGFWMKTDNIVVEGDGIGAGMNLSFQNSGYVDVGTPISIGLTTGTTDWTYHELVFTVPADANLMNVNCQISGATGEAWFDDLTLLTEWEDPTPTLAPTQAAGSSEDESPSTGDVSSIGFLLLAVAAGSGTFLMRKKTR